MKYSIVHYLIIFVAVALLSSGTGCRLNGPFYHPTAWQFYNPFKGDSNTEYADNAFDDLPGEPKSQPPASMAKLDSPSVAKPVGGYGNGNEFNDRAAAFSSTQSNASMNLDAKDKNAIGVQDGLFASRSTTDESLSQGVASSGATQSVATQTPSVIARNSNDQPWNLPSAANEPNAGFASSQGFAAPTSTPQVASTQPITSIPGITHNYAVPTNTMPMVDSAAPATATSFPTQSMEMQPGIPQQPVVQQPYMQQPFVQQPMVQQPMVQQPMVQQTAPVYYDNAVPPVTTQYPQTQPNAGFQPTPIPEQSNPNYSSGFTSFAPNTTDSYRPGTY